MDGTLELNDAGLMFGLHDGHEARLARLDGDSPESPGMAFSDGHRHLVGLAAEQQVCLMPKQVTDRFWSEFSNKPCGLPGADRITFASFAKLHLKQILEQVSPVPSRLAFAAPGHFDPERVALLAGLAARFEKPLAGIYDMAVVAAHAWYTAEKPEHRSALVIDTFLHATHVTLTS
ncbi:MAG: hypothetical protein AAF492_27950, partial [Verrucomicrobiota bacterium]